MKKKILSIIVVVIVTLVAGYTINQEKKEVALSDIALNNIDALANGEIGWGLCTYYGCMWDYYYNCSVYEFGIYKGTCENARG